MGKPLSNSDTRSFNGSIGGNSSNEKKPLLFNQIEERDKDLDHETEKDVTNSSLILQNYILSKKNQLSSSKSQLFLAPKEKDKERQIQRKLTYNLVRPM